MVHVIHVGDFYPKIVNDEAENNTSPDVAPEARSVLALVISLFGQSFFEELVGDDSGLREAVHSFSNFDIDPSFFVDKVSEVVLYDDFFGDDVKSEAHVFWIGHRSVQVEVCQVDAEEHGSRCTDGGVDEEFGGEKVRGGGAHVPGKIDEIPADR